MKKICLWILVASSILMGCKKIITEVPYSFLTPQNFPTSAVEADAALIGCYTTLKGNGFGTWDYVGGLYMNSQNDNIRGGGGWAQFTGATHGSESDWWSDYWKGINSANNLIFALESRDGSTDKWVPEKLAEARAIRAFFYHNLASLYGDLPLRLKPTTETSLILPRSPVKSIYDSIILPDLLFADGKLPVTANPSGRISAGALNCIKADVYMKLAGWRRSSQGQMVAGDPKYWPMARDAAQAVLTMESNGVYALEPQYSQVFTKLSTDVNTKEVIFDLEFTSGSRAGSNFPYVYGAQGGGDPDKGSGQRNSRVIPEWVRTQDTSDERYQWNIGNYEFKTGWIRTPLADTNNWGVTTFQKIFPSKGYFQTHLTNWPFYRLSEVKLMYAEAANEANGGPTPEAYAQLNAVRYRARPATHKTDGTVLPDLSGLTQAQFRAAIMNERAMELILEGKRRLDLIRWGVFKEKIESLSIFQAALNSVGGFNMRYYLWSLPVGDMTTNSWQNNAGF
jgi:hypothetical protein